MQPLNMGLKQAGQPSDLNHLVILYFLALTQALLQQNSFAWEPCAMCPQLPPALAALLLTAVLFSLLMLTPQKASGEWGVPRKRTALIHPVPISSLF